MRMRSLYWRPWDQGKAIANARAASLELRRACLEREEVYRYLAQLAESRRKTRAPDTTARSAGVRTGHCRGMPPRRRFQCPAMARR